MPLPLCFGPKTYHYLLKGAGLLGATASGFYTTYRIMWNFDDLRWAIVFCYLVVFNMMMISAELNLLGHRHFRRFGRFLTTFVGRAFFYIFIGGLMLDGVPGWIIGIYLMTLGVVNIIAQCACSGEEASKVDAVHSTAI
jgi:hypothetical protein